MRILKVARDGGGLRKKETGGWEGGERSPGCKHPSARVAARTTPRYYFFHSIFVSFYFCVFAGERLPTVVPFWQSSPSPQIESNAFEGFTVSRTFKYQNHLKNIVATKRGGGKTMLRAAEVPSADMRIVQK